MPVLMLLMLLIYHISTQIELSQTKCNPTPLCLWIDKNVFTFFVCNWFILTVTGVHTNFCLTLYCCWSKWEFMQLQQGHRPNCHHCRPDILQDTLELLSQMSTQPVSCLKNKESHLSRSQTTVRPTALYTMRVILLWMNTWWYLIIKFLLINL